MGKVLIVTTVWKRPEVTELTYKGFDRIQSILKEEGIDSEVLVISSEPDHTARAILRGYSVFETTNEPLGNKFNEGLKHALTLKWDYLFEMNSNNLVSDLYVRIWCAAARQGIPMFGSGHFYVLMPDRNRFSRFRVKNQGLSGVGRGVERGVYEKVLEEVGYICDPEKTSDIDCDTRQRAEKVTGRKVVQICGGEYPGVLDIKSGEDMHHHATSVEKPRMQFFLDNWPELEDYLDI